MGHSVGSLIARVFTGRNQRRVIGAVHVDGSIPRLALWPVVDIPQPPDGDGPDATHFDTLTGEVEVLQSRRASEVRSAVVTRTPGRWEPPWPAEALDPLWLAHQRRLAWSLDTPLIVAADAGHQIPDEAPELVAYLIDEVIDHCRRDLTMLMPDQERLAVAGGRADRPWEDIPHWNS
ncbi:hypothetical protein [Actinoplanes sp. URMC 104]|uniref:hypothetical protein n=1 Tax=Actinoplanes sp. URMC 104 TaxID=3423409 RepID=UPI003F196D43